MTTTTVNGTAGLANGESNGIHIKGAAGLLDWSKFQNTIDGDLVTSSHTTHSINPATGEAGPDVPVASREDVERTMVAAQAAFEKWAAVSHSDRRKAILAFADALEVEKENFSQMLTSEQGKPVSSDQACILRAQDTDMRYSWYSRGWNSTSLFIGYAQWQLWSCQKNAPLRMIRRLWCDTPLSV